MKRNALDMTVLVLGIVFIGLLSLNRYMLQPVWKSEIKTEITALKEEMQDTRQEVKDDLKTTTEELKDEHNSVKDDLKEARDEQKAELKEMSTELKSAF